MGVFDGCHRRDDSIDLDRDFSTTDWKFQYETSSVDAKKIGNENSTSTSSLSEYQKSRKNIRDDALRNTSSFTGWSARHRMWGRVLGIWFRGPPSIF